MIPELMFIYNIVPQVPSWNVIIRIVPYLEGILNALSSDGERY